MVEKEYQIIRVAELYYKQGYSQQEISAMMGTSRPTISRLLNEAREKGIVKISINTPVNINYDLSTKIKKKFGLKDALVVNVSDDNEALAISQVGYEAARLVTSLLKNDLIIGISFGKHVKHVIEAIPEIDINNIKIVQMVGALGNGDPNTDGPELVINLASRLNGEYRYINSPAVVNDINLKNSLLEHTQIKSNLNLINKCDIAIHGIGSLDESNSSMKRSGYMDDNLREKYKKDGAVGNILGHLVNSDGQLVKESNHHTIGAPLDLLKNIEWSIGVATNVIKHTAVLAAIKGKHVNCLVVNYSLANKLLNETDS